jgi:hypothetical protein
MTTQICKAAIIATFGFTVSNVTAQTERNQHSAAFGSDRHASCTESNTVSRRVDFADVHRARHLLGRRDDWARQLSDFDLGIRQKTAARTSLNKFLDFAENAGRGWTLQEKAGWQPLIDKLSKAMKGLDLELPDIDLVKTSGNEEFDAAYTRERAIMFPQSIVSEHASAPRGVYFLLAHEMFHVLSRADSRLRDELYALLGFKKVRGFDYPAELEERRVSNPDAFEYQHTLTVQTASGNVDVLPVNQSLVPLNEAIQLPNFFTALDIVLLAVNPRTGKARRDSNGNLIKYSFDNTNWVPLMLRNSSYIIHAEEVMADNFATLMEWRADGALPPTNPGGFAVNDMNLLVAIQKVLASGCRK